MMQKGRLGMRYMRLIYSQEQPGGTRHTSTRNHAGQRAVVDEADRKGVFEAAQPLAPTPTATTVSLDGRKTLITDGPFAETKDQLAGYYIPDCENLDEGIEWAVRIPTACKGAEGCIDVRPLTGIPAPPSTEAGLDHALTRNG
jgi:hypothetical protein